ncbi:MAG TPA: hypothetical protein VFL17_21230 [Anaerolineae bacterium]|nr:hypothetical protein [Anaerolineae bacterium]
MSSTLFTHAPKVLISEVFAAPLVWPLVVAAVLTAGLVGFRRRDVRRV